MKAAMQRTMDSAICRSRCRGWVDIYLDIYHQFIMFIGCDCKKSSEVFNMSHTCSMEPQKPTLFSEVSQAFLEHTEKCRYYKVIDQMSEFILESLVYWVEKFFLRSGAYVYARVCVRQKKKRGRERENFYQRKFFVEFFYLFFSILCTIFLISFENLNIHYLKSVFFQLPYTMSKVLCIMLWFNILCLPYARLYLLSLYPVVTPYASI